MSLPLPLVASEPCPVLTERQRVPSIETLRLYEGEAEELDSASDLSDSERLPVPPSPCSPPQLHLRAEVFDPNDLDPYFPGPRGNQSGYCYPDFLPPPFNTWSLRQLALFLNTEGRCAYRPQPVGQLEKYLERLLQLEWLQIQTVEMENGKTTTPASATARQPPQTPHSSGLVPQLAQEHPAVPACLPHCLPVLPGERLRPPALPGGLPSLPGPLPLL